MSLNFEGLIVVLSGANDTGLVPGQIGSIALPPDIISRLPGSDDISVAFAFFRDADLFPVRENLTEYKRTVVGSSVLSAQVSGIAPGTELNSTVQVFFVLNNASVPGPNETASRRCAFWDFTAAGKQIVLNMYYTSYTFWISLLFLLLLLLISHQVVVVIGTQVVVL